MGNANRKPQHDERGHLLRGLRLFDWSRQSAPAPLPPLLTAMRQLRQHVLDVHGDGVAPFVERVKTIAAHARDSGEPETAAMLMKLAAVAELGNHLDVRADLIDLLDLAHAALNPPCE